MDSCYRILWWWIAVLHFSLIFSISAKLELKSCCWEMAQYIFSSFSPFLEFIWHDIYKTQKLWDPLVASDWSHTLRYFFPQNNDMSIFLLVIWLKRCITLKEWTVRNPWIIEIQFFILKGCLRSYHFSWITFQKI